MTASNNPLLTPLGILIVPKMGDSLDFFKAVLPEYDWLCLTENQIKPADEKTIASYQHVDLVTWGYKGSKVLKSLRKIKPNARTLYAEDGFVRSASLGRTGECPMSICIDTRGMYFDATKLSDLEVLLSTYDFQANPLLISEAKRCIGELLLQEVSKYNFIDAKGIESTYGRKTARRILVVGQCEDDASIKYGCSKVLTNNDLVRLAREENSNAEIFYKPHPDVLQGYRKALSDPTEVQQIARVISEPLTISDALKTIDHVYTITSLSGFEALLRGIKVTTLGCPFYSGWGLTDDRQVNTRRNRRLSMEEVFAGAYLLYCKYFDTDSKSLVSLSFVINKLTRKKQMQNENAAGQ